MLFGIKSGFKNVSQSDDVKFYVIPSYPSDQGFGEKEELVCDLSIAIQKPSIFVVFETYIDITSTDGNANINWFTMSLALNKGTACPCQVNKITTSNFKEQLASLSE